MTTLVVFVALYLAATVAIGLIAARRVHNSADYLVAGRSLPLYMNMATVFATWFGAETVLSVSATFAKDGLGGVVGDPFGSSMALVIVALFFAAGFYKMGLLTIGDFYKKRYNKKVELITSVAIAVSYLGWASAQLTALGLVFSVLSRGAISLNEGIMLGAVVVLLYTIWGGMWSIAFTDLLQSVVIVAGLTFVAWLVGDMAGGAANVIAKAHADAKFTFFPSGGLKEWLPFIAAFFTVAFGSVPQQDVFQRVTSAKDAKTARNGTLFGAGFYFIFAFIPIFIAYAALVIDPSMAKLLGAEDARDIQRILPDLILNKTPLWAQVLFFGALLSAILSTASGTLLAPTAIISENIIKPFRPHMGDRQLLVTLRVVLVFFTVGILLFALNSKSTMYEMVQNAYKVTLVGAFIPLAAGFFWKRATSTGALVSSLSGIGSWLVMEYLASAALAAKAEPSIWPPQIIGFGFALIGMIVGSLASRPEPAKAMLTDTDA